MQAFFSGLIDGIEFSGSVRQDVAALFNHFEMTPTAAHCFDVAEHAVRLAIRFGADRGEAALAGWLHDISKVIPNDQRLAAAQTLELEILPEEAEAPMLLHQKLSVEIAREVFNIRRDEVLEAIRCHTTLRPQPSLLDQVLFVADKITLYQEAPPPYLEEVQAALERSLEEACWRYQDYLMHSGKILIPHPWMLASYAELSEKYG